MLTEKKYLFGSELRFEDIRYGLWKIHTSECNCMNIKKNDFYCYYDFFFLFFCFCLSQSQSDHTCKKCCKTLLYHVTVNLCNLTFNDEIWEINKLLFNKFEIALKHKMCIRNMQKYHISQKIMLTSWNMVLSLNHDFWLKVIIN